MVRSTKLSSWYVRDSPFFWFLYLCVCPPTPPPVPPREEVLHCHFQGFALAKNYSHVNSSLPNTPGPPPQGHCLSSYCSLLTPRSFFSHRNLTFLNCFGILLDSPGTIKFPLFCLQRPTLDQSSLTRSTFVVIINSVLHCVCYFPVQFCYSFLLPLNG